MASCATFVAVAAAGELAAAVFDLPLLLRPKSLLKKLRESLFSPDIIDGAEEGEWGKGGERALNEGNSAHTNQSAMAQWCSSTDIAPARCTALPLQTAHAQSASRPSPATRLHRLHCELPSSTPSCPAYWHNGLTRSAAAYCHCRLVRCSSGAEVESACSWTERAQWGASGQKHGEGATED